MPLPSFSFPLAVSAPEVVTVADDPTALPFAELELDTLTGDLKLPPAIITGVAALRQRLDVRLQFFKGEWVLDTRQGIPYYEAIFIKNPNLSLVQQIFRRAILSTPGVQSIAKMQVNFDTATRAFTIDPLEIVLTGGVVFRVQADELIIPLPSELLE